ncbi:hypothetical protein [Oligosphaera ethanolica]|uniref:Uncharacterized protein n=1 Tax=Oligosphaera ethanolica TaxID=760260 RepID=A0AAE3VFB5_9BACT|nr:hypothetical protein [Oligosphaera ethanolica]MDQ0289469.1 hypothetical protein [Oligosphaera ethanolica]
MAAALDTLDSRYDKAVWMLINHDEVWDKAAILAHADSLQERSWHKRNGLPKEPPDLSPAALQQLQTDISAFFWQAQGRGKLCHIEPLRRNAHQDYLFVYLGDHPDTEIIWESDGSWCQRQVESVPLAAAGSVHFWHSLWPHFRAIFSSAFS